MRRLFPDNEKLLRWLDLAEEKFRIKVYHQELHGWVMANVQRWV